MKLRLFLARQAEVQANLLYALGLGVTDIGPDPSQFAICCLIEIGWEETSRRHTLLFTIVDADEQPFQVPTLTGDQPFQVPAQFEAGRPPGVTPGRSFIMPVSVTIAPVQFRPGTDYVVKASVDGNLLDETPLHVRPRPPQPPQA